jgi:aminoglycoside phosphotransferase (APT) family kinase protein
MQMHEGEARIDADLVGRLVEDQFPELGDLQIREFRSIGTVNAIYRLGDHLYARLPRVREWAPGLVREWQWLPKLAPHVSLLIPEPVGLGAASGSYPFAWAIYRWIDGRPYAEELIEDEQQAAGDLARFVHEMRRIDPAAGAPRGGREPLGELDDQTRAAIRSARGTIDSDAVVSAWDRALEAPVWQGTPVWVHADLLRPNLLVRDGRLRAVIDFGGAGVGDPAADVIAAWTVFSRTGRGVFRGALDVDDGTWSRARGFALHQAAMIIPYYRETNPGFVEEAKRIIEEVLADEAESRSTTV